MKLFFIYYIVYIFLLLYRLCNVQGKWRWNQTFQCRGCYRSWVADRFVGNLDVWKMAAQVCFHHCNKICYWTEFLVPAEVYCIGRKTYFDISFQWSRNKPPISKCDSKPIYFLFFVQKRILLMTGDKETYCRVCIIWCYERFFNFSKIENREPDLFVCHPIVPCISSFQGLYINALMNDWGIIDMRNHRVVVFCLYLTFTKNMCNLNLNTISYFSIDLHFFTSCQMQIKFSNIESSRMD